MENTYQRFAKDVLTIGVANALVALSSVIFVPLITKTLGVFDYGIWAQVQVTVNLVVGFVGLGLPQAMTRFLPVKKDREEIQEEFYSVFFVTFLTTAIVSAIFIVFADFIAGAFFAGAAEIVKITALIILAWSLDNVFLSLFVAFRQMKRYALFTVANTYVQVGLIAYLILNGHGILSTVLVVLAIRAVMFVILFYLIGLQIGIKKPRFSRISEYLHFGIPTVPGSISAWVIAASDRYVIGYFLGAASVGVYSAGYNIGSIPSMIIHVLAFVLVPTLSKLYDEGRMEEVKTHLRFSLKYSLALGIPFSIGAFVLAQPVLRVFSTAQIATNGYAIVPLVALGTLLYAGSVPMAQILILAKKTGITGATWVICGLANLGLNILVVPRWGILGAAITTLIAYGLRLGLVAYYSSKQFKFTIDWRFIGKSVVASGAMAAALWGISPQGTLATVLAIVAGTAIYGSALFLLRGFTKEEFRFFRQLLQKSQSNVSGQL